MKNIWVMTICMFSVCLLLTCESFGQKRAGKQRRTGRSQSGIQSRGPQKQGFQNQGPQKQGAQSQRGSQKQKGCFGAGNSSRSGQGQNRVGAGNRSLTEKDVQNLVHMREEEKLARDVYTAMHDKWGNKVFSNIAGAEARHMMAVGNLLSRYGIPDPIKNQAAGAFTDPKLQKLYDTLVAQGKKSVQDAFKVGLQIEELDIADLKNTLKATSNTDIQRILGNLMRGSQAHLSAFASQLAAQGGSYSAQHLPQKEFDQIANSGGSGGRGFGGRGSSNRGARQRGATNRGPANRAGNQRGPRFGGGKGFQKGGKKGSR